jgi:hypothetical protein
MTRDELKAGVDRLLADLASLGDAIDRMMATGTERLIPDHERHANLGTVRQGISEIHAEAQQLGAGLAPDVAPPKPAKARKPAAPRKRK